MTPREDRCLPLDARPTSAPASRAFVRAVLASWGQAGMTDDVELLVSELVSNAVRHAATPLTLTIAWREAESRLRVTVEDDSPLLPILRGFDATATTGRGMQIIAALAHSSGVLPTATGKGVWFEMSPGGT